MYPLAQCRKLSQEVYHDSASAITEVEIKKPGSGILKSTKRSIKRKTQSLTHDTDETVVEPLLQKDDEDESNNKCANSMFTKSFVKTDDRKDCLNVGEVKINIDIKKNGDCKDGKNVQEDISKSEHKTIETENMITFSSPSFRNNPIKSVYSNEVEDDNCVLKENIQSKICNDSKKCRDNIKPVRETNTTEAISDTQPIIFTTAKIHTGSINTQGTHLNNQIPKSSVLSTKDKVPDILPSTNTTSLPSVRNESTNKSTNSTQQSVTVKDITNYKSQLPNSKMKNSNEKEPNSIQKLTSVTKQVDSKESTKPITSFLNKTSTLITVVNAPETCKNSEQKNADKIGSKQSPTGSSTEATTSLETNSIIKLERNNEENPKSSSTLSNKSSNSNVKMETNFNKNRESTATLNTTIKDKTNNENKEKNKPNASANRITEKPSTDSKLKTQVNRTSTYKTSENNYDKQKTGHSDTTTSDKIKSNVNTNLSKKNISTGKSDKIVKKTTEQNEKSVNKTNNIADQNKDDKSVTALKKSTPTEQPSTTVKYTESRLEPSHKEQLLKEKSKTQIDTNQQKIKK